MTLLPTRAPRPARSRAVVGAAALVVGLGMASVAAPASAADHVLSPGEIDKSDNISLVKNLPKSGAFEPEGAFSSDLAFKGDYAFAGNYNGFTVYDISDPENTTEALQVVCVGAQNDITVLGDLMFLSVDSRRTDDSCSSSAATNLQSAAGDYWEGIRIWDISDPLQPEYVKSVETDCGSHTHTLVPEGDSVFVYVSSYGPFTVNVAPQGSPADPRPIARCQDPHDSISIVEVPVDDPEAAEVVATPVLFEDGGLTSRTQGCHDITAYPAIDRAAGACMGEGVILDISDPVEPVVLDRVADTENFAFWHSATFSNDARTVMFTDELGGGGGATCNPVVGPDKGANAYYRLKKDELTFQSYFKIPREQASTENCVAHNGSLIPVQGKDIMVQAWYQGGINVVDFTNPKKPREIAHFDRGPLSEERLVLGGSWSAYYYDGYIYSNDIQQGLDVLQLDDRRLTSAGLAEFPTDYNPQTQPRL